MTACHPEHLDALVPFCVHVLHIRRITQINALSSFLLKEQVLSLSPHHHTLFVPHDGLHLTPHLIPPPPRHPQPFLPTWPCLRAPPLEGQVNRGPGSAQARLVPIRSLIRHFNSFLTACQLSPKPLSLACVYVLWLQLYGSLEVQNHISKTKHDQIYKIKWTHALQKT